MSILPLIIILSVIFIGAIILIIVGIKSPQGADPLEDRLAEYAARGEMYRWRNELSSHFRSESLYRLLKEWVSSSCVLLHKTQFHPCEKVELGKSW
jgi:hypothetical protein